MPELVSAEFRPGEELEKDKLYELNVMDYSRHGLGLIIGKENLDLLKKLKNGDMIKDMSYFAAQAIIKLDGVVRHMTKIREGRYKDCYLLGIESLSLIDK